jgi:hypothetical protein
MHSCLTKRNVGVQVISYRKEKGIGIVQGSNIGLHDIASWGTGKCFIPSFRTHMYTQELLLPTFWETILPLFKILSCFVFSRYIVFTIYTYIYTMSRYIVKNYVWWKAKTTYHVERMGGTILNKEIIVMKFFQSWMTSTVYCNPLFTMHVWHTCA